MKSESSEQGESSEQVTTSGIPRGGPIYLPNMVGHVSTVDEFQSSFLNLLEDLDAHLSLESPSSSQQYDVSYVFIAASMGSSSSSSFAPFKPGIHEKVCNWEFWMQN